VFNYPQLWMASSIPRNLLPRHNQPQQQRQQQQQQQQPQQQQQNPQPQQHPQQSRLGVASFIEPPPRYEDVTPRMEDVTDDDDGDVVEISDAEEEEREVVNSEYEAEEED